jgi:U3 small nucleolar RNA-associated protein 25
MLSTILLGSTKGVVMNLKRFMEEFGGEELAMPRKNPRPEDYEQTFAGNTDDTFRVGLTVTKKCLKVIQNPCWRLII